MSEEEKKGISRRDFMKSVSAAAVAGSALSMALPKEAHAAKKLKIGFMAPYTGPASRTGDMHRKGVEMALEEARARAVAYGLTSEEVTDLFDGVLLKHRDRLRR